MEKPSNELKNSAYEIFIAALSVLSIANIFIHLLATDPDVEGVIEIIDYGLSFVFLGDFLYRLFTADSKSGYFLRQFGWADLLASLPFPQAKLLRIFRLVRAGRMIRKHGPRHLVEEVAGNRGGSALLSLLFLMVLVLEFGGMAILAAEGKSPDANIHTASDSLWYIYVTITTVGYGDRYPVTGQGRIIGVLILTVGIGLFGTLTGFLANAFLAPPKAAELQEEAASSEIVATGEVEGAVQTAAPSGTLAAKLAEFHELLAEQQKTQMTLQNKIAELEQYLVTLSAEHS